MSNLKLITRASCIAGVAGYTWVAILHLWLTFSFKTTLMLANITSVAWLVIYYTVLPPPKAEAASQLHSLTSSRSRSMAYPPHDQHVVGASIEADAQEVSESGEHSPRPRPGADADANVQTVLLAACRLDFDLQLWVPLL